MGDERHLSPSTLDLDAEIGSGQGHMSCEVCLRLNLHRYNSTPLGFSLVDATISTFSQLILYNVSPIAIANLIPTGK